MPDVIFVAVHLIRARVGFHQKPVCKAGLAKHPAIRCAGLIGTDMAAGYPGLHAITIFPK